MSSPASSTASLGERLQEARKRRGLSLRDAAEATKIRSDFLSAMEDNSLAIDLPEVYRRGFLKSYARFLKLDTDRAIAEYEDIIARTGGRGTEHKSAATHRKSLGRFEIKGHDANTRASSGRADQPLDGEELSDSSPALIPPAAKKLGLVVLGFVVLVWIGVWLGSDPSPSPRTNPGLSSSPTPTPSPTPAISAPNNRTPSSVTIGATTRLVNFTVTDIASQKVLFNAPVAAGTSHTILRHNGGQVRVDFSDRSAVRLSRDGKPAESIAFQGTGSGFYEPY